MKKIFALLFLIMLGVSIPATVFLVQRQQELRGRAAPATTLSLIPSSSSVAVGQTFTVAVQITTGVNQVVGTQLALTFDAGKLTANDITVGSFFLNPQTTGKAIDNSTGTIAYTIYIPLPGGTPQSGQGTIATITFVAKAPGTGAIGIADTTLVGASQEGQNVLQTKVPTTVTITDTQPTATPTPQAGTTPSPTPTSPPQTVTPTPATPNPSPTPPAPTPTTTSTSTSNTVPTATPEKVAHVSPTPATLPSAGTSLPTLVIGSVGILLTILGFLVLAL